MKGKGSRQLRPVPKNDAQLDFFVPHVFDAPVKDDVNIMDIAPFTLAKNVRTEPLVYHLKHATVTVEGSPQHGIATVFDYDIVLNMISHLAAEVRRSNRRPPSSYQPAAAEILKFCRREQGGKQYKQLEAALDRLDTTRIKIETAGNVRRTGAFNLIDGYIIKSRTKTGKIDEVKIGVPQWIYEGVVSHRPSILTLNPDYFLLRKGIARFLYRLSRKAAGETDARYTMAEIHKRSGSPMRLTEFARQVRLIVEAVEENVLPDYELSIEKKSEGEVLLIRRREGQ